MCFWDVSGELVRLLGRFCDKSKGLGWFSLLSFLRTERTKLPFSVKSSRPARRRGDHAMQIKAAFEAAKAGLLN